jgi:NAD(P)-dependent dehydrogenase (short-subunit alcohol dehydrogenase family)
MNSGTTFSPDLFRGRQVLVVGGTSGIGAGVAGAFCIEQYLR